MLQSHILVIDDDPAVRQLLAETLTGEGHQAPITNFLIRKGNHFFEIVIYLLALVSVVLFLVAIIFVFRINKL